MAVATFVALLVLNEISGHLADNFGSTAGLVLMALILLAVFVLISTVEPLRRAFRAPFDQALTVGESYGYSGLLIRASGRGSSSSSSSSTSRSAPGGGPAPVSPRSGGAGGARGAGGRSKATGDERSVLSVPDLPTTTLLVASATNIDLGRPVVLTAEVRAAEGEPTGRIEFVFNDKVGRRASLRRSFGAGTASVTLRDLKVGVYDVVARYRGSGQFQPSSSDMVRVTVRPRESS
jgi:hypothetical protein